MILGMIEEGILKGKKMILDPRVNLKENEYLVEEGTFFNDIPKFSLYCLTKGCEKQIAGHCERCG